METADERRNHEGVGVIKITESMGMPCEGFMIPDKYKEYLGSVLLTKGMIKDRTAKLASDIKSCADNSRIWDRPSPMNFFELRERPPMEL